MKKLTILFVLVSLLLCGCAEGTPEVDVDAVLKGVVESIDWEELQDYVQQGADTVLEKYPALKKLTNREDLQDLLKDNGLSLLGKYIASTEPDVQENAAKLGAILKILSPELTDEVDAVFAENEVTLPQT